MDSLSPSVRPSSGAARLMARIAQTDKRQAARSERLAQLERQQLALERQSRAVEDWVTVWCRGSDRVAQASFRERRAWLDKFGIEVVVAKHGSPGPRYEVSINLLVEVESVPNFDPNREITVKLEGHFVAHAIEPSRWTPEQQMRVQE